MLYQRPHESDLDFKTELQRMAELMERLALEATESARSKEVQANQLRKNAEVLAAKGAEYRRLFEARPSAAIDDYDDIPF